MKTLYIIDGYMYIYTSLYSRVGHELTSPSGELTTGTYVFTKTLMKLLRNYCPNMLCVAMDHPSETFRRKIYEGYKDNRSENAPEGFFQQKKRIEQILEIMGIPVLAAPSYEADDVIGTVVEKASIQGDIKVTICSRDKDFAQLVKREKVDILDMNKGVRTGEEEILKKWGIYPHQFVDFLAFQGDSSDNVPGVHGIGPKGAVELLQDWGSAEEVYKNLKSIKGKLAEKLEKGREIFELSKQLVEIRKGIPIDINFEAMEVRDYDSQRLDRLFEELGFNSLIERRTNSGRRLF